MNAMDLFSAPLAQAIGWALLHLLWQATIVAGILAAALALLSRHSANARYAVSCAALTLVFVMFAGTAWKSYEPKKPIENRVTSTTTAPEQDMVPLEKAPVFIAAAATASWRDRALEIVTGARQSLPIVVAIWLAGVVVLSSRLLVSWARTRRLTRQGATEASEQWQRIAKRLSDALGLRRAVRLIESAAVEVPSVIGSLRPVILLPASALTGMTPEQIEMVLAHELAHIRRHDFLVNLLQAVVETLMFYHPAVWWMSRRVRIERENCCDDLAVAVCGNPLQYARALTRLEELRAHAPVITVAANGGSLLDRIRRIVAERAESTGSSSRWAAAVAMLSVIIIALAVPSLPALADRDQQPPAPPEPPAAQVEVVAPAPPEPAEPATPDEDTEEELLDDPDIEIDLDAIAAMAPVIATSVVVPAMPAPPAPLPYPAPRVRVVPAVAPMVDAHAVAVAALAELGHVDDDDDEEQDDAKHESRRKFGESGKLTVDELIQLRVAGVTPDYIEKMRAVFPDLTLGDLVSMKHMDVTPEYISEMRAAGVNIKSGREANQLRAMNVTAKFVKKLAEAGYANLSVKELTRLAAAGVDDNFIREMSKYRDKQ